MSFLTGVPTNSPHICKLGQTWVTMFWNWEENGHSSVSTFSHLGKQSNLPKPGEIWVNW